MKITFEAILNWFYHRPNPIEYDLFRDLLLQKQQSCYSNAIESNKHVLTLLFHVTKINKFMNSSVMPIGKRFRNLIRNRLKLFAHDGQTFLLCLLLQRHHFQIDHNRSIFSQNLFGFWRITHMRFGWMNSNTTFAQDMSIQ